MSNHVHLSEVLSIPGSPQTVANNHAENIYVEPQLKADLKRLIEPIIKYHKSCEFPLSKGELITLCNIITNSLPELEKLIE